jgi:hypothetical protein
LLNLYRRLIHLRKENEALATGRLAPLTASSQHAIAFLRRSGGQAVMVVANLGDSASTTISIAGPAGVLPVGRYVPRSLLGDPTPAPLLVSKDGSIQGYVPVRRLRARQSLVLYLSRTTAP